MPWFFPSFLTPTFLVLGLLAISLPILFHFFRRTPKGNVRFSTLMFLRPSPPRLTRRSRVDNWLLLLLRALVLLFIALAFGRIFFRQTDFLNLTDLPSRRVAILVDTSASMMRGKLWSQAKQEFIRVLDEMGPKDEVAVYTYDRELVPVVGFSSGGQPHQLAASELLRTSLESVSPRWRDTDLGRALVDVVDELKADQESDSKDQISESQIVLITDLQAGSNIQQLQSFEWPKNIPLEIKTVGDEISDNATLSLLDPSSGISSDSKVRVKVTNAKDSQLSQFDLKWITGEDNDAVAATIVVPPGQSRVINLTPPDFDFDGLELEGDADSFDNRYYLAYPKLVPRKILFVGNEDDVRNQLRFYLKKACASLIGKRFEFSDLSSFDEFVASKGGQPDIVFVTGSLDSSQANKILEFNKQGGLVCVVVTDEGMQATVSTLMENSVELSKSESKDFSLLAKIDFSHKLFAPFADPKYSNFSNIRFWKHRNVKAESLKPLATFDNGALAIGYRSTGEGQFYLLTSGWHPADSQLALSSKFVGIMMSMMLKTLTRENRNLLLGLPVTLSDFLPGETCKVTTPEGDELNVGELSRPRVLAEASVPGIYQISSSTQTKRIAFNLPASESQTSRLDTELLEQENVKLGTMESATEQIEKERQRKDTELENRQKLWRWMLILALVTLFAETFLSSYFARRQTQGDAVATDSSTTPEGTSHPEEGVS